MYNRLTRRVVQVQVRFALQQRFNDFLEAWRLLGQRQHQRRKAVLLVLQIEHRTIGHEMLHDVQLIFGYRHVQH